MSVSKSTSSNDCRSDASEVSLGSGTLSIARHDGSIGSAQATICPLKTLRAWFLDVFTMVMGTFRSVRCVQTVPLH